MSSSSRPGSSTESRTRVLAISRSSWSQHRSTMHSSGFLPVDMAGMRVLVTAGGAGIGRTIAAAFRERGARVFICDVSRQALDETHALLPDVPGELVDVADATAVADMFASIERAFGGLDVLVNNAGIAGPTAHV